MNIKMILLLLLSGVMISGSSTSKMNFQDNSDTSSSAEELNYAKQVDSLQEREFTKVCQYLQHEKNTDAINSNHRGK